MSPRAKKFVAEHPFVVPSIQGTGAGGRIMEADVERLAQVPEITQAAAEEIYRYFHDQPSDADEQYTQHSPADAGEE